MLSNISFGPESYIYSLLIHYYKILHTIFITKFAESEFS